MSATLSSTVSNAAVMLEALRAQPAGARGALPSTSRDTSPSQLSKTLMERAPTLSELHAVLIMAPGLPRDALATGLWDAGMLVTAFGSPHEAEGVLIGEPVHAVLLDAALGLELAPQVAWWLGAMGRGGVRVVVFGEVEQAARESLLAQGVAWVVPRPTQPGTFARQLAQAMGFRGNAWR